MYAGRAPFPRSLAWTIAVVAMLTMAVSYVDRTTLAVLAPTVTKALAISDTAYGWLTASFSVAYLIATPLAGRWIDRVGARRGLVVSLLVWSTIAALHALVPGFGALLALRIALGLAEGPGFPGATQTMQRVLDERDRARGFGVLFVGSSLGAMIAPPLASWLYDLAGWRVAFLGTAAVGIAWVPAWLALTSRARERMDRAPNAKDFGPRTSGLGIRWPKSEVRGPRSDSGFGALFELLATPAMLRALVAIFAVAPVLGFVQAWGAKYLANVFGIAQGEMGKFLWLPSLGFDAGALLFGDLLARTRNPRLLLACAAALAFTLASLPFVNGVWDTIELATLALAGTGAMYTVVTAELMTRTAPERVALAGGVLAGAQSLALIIESPLIGAALDRGYGYPTIAFVIGVWVIPGAVVWIVTRSAAGSSSTP